MRQTATDTLLLARQFSLETLMTPDQCATALDLLNRVPTPPQAGRIELDVLPAGGGYRFSARVRRFALVMVSTSASAAGTITVNAAGKTVLMGRTALGAGWYTRLILVGLVALLVGALLDPLARWIILLPAAPVVFYLGWQMQVDRRYLLRRIGAAVIPVIETMDTPQQTA